MKKSFILILLVFTSSLLFSQKKPLDHSVYDSWQRIGERMISKDGKWVVYTVDPQEGDNELIIQSTDGSYKKSVARGYSSSITEDSRFLIFKIKPQYKDIREARIKKKKMDEMPKDSLAILELGKENIWKAARIKNYKTPSKSFGWLAYQLEKPTEPGTKQVPVNSNRKLDSLNHVIDSLKILIQAEPQKKKKKNRDDEDDDFADADENTNSDAGSDLVLRNLSVGDEIIFPFVQEYYFSKAGNKLLLKHGRNSKDSLSKPMIVVYDLERKQSHNIIKGGNDFKNLTISDDGMQVAFVAEREAKPKDLQRFYKLWYYKEGMDSAIMIADRSSVGMRLGLTVSEFSSLDFSKSGQRLFFGTTAILPPRDTSLIDIDIPKVDIWHYKDDYLQTVQNFPTRLRAEQQRSYLAVYDLNKKSIKQLANRELPQIITTNEGDGDMFIGITDFGKRVESQWVGVTRKDIYAVNPVTGGNKLIKENLHGQTYPSSTGKYIVWFDRKTKNYFSWDGTSTKNISSKVKVPLWNESDEVPDDPGPYGIMKWSKDDDALFVYDKYGVWKLDPTAKKAPVLALDGRKTKSIYRYVQLDPEERYIESGEKLVFRKLNDINKNAGLWEMVFNATIGLFEQPRAIVPDSGIAINQVQKALNSNVYLLTKESFTSPADLYTITVPDRYSASSFSPETVRLSFINPQQKSYNWGSAELVRWKAYDKKDAVGILYKPEDFNPKKKYPMIIYFYEDLSNNLNNYHAPAPIRSAINIPFFVSRGYIIFLPDIHYTTGHPGRDAYNYIVSGARAVVKKGFVDSTRMALQGHSWGGYQAAQVVTMTKIFKAAWAGAPVANMTSAYGGIRWESGVSRQWQYEKSQSRIGATLWEKPELYIENSPLFHLNKVTTPMVIMANDADGAVPWYQGIELFTGLRRLGKKVWMFNYNGQGHGLTQRQDMRDYQIRMQQFFDWILKDQPPAKWITEGLPATKKGKELGLEL